MKKKIALVVCSMALFGMTFTGCASEDVTATDASMESTTQSVESSATTIDVSSLDTEGSISELACADYVTIGDYLGVEVSVPEIVVSDEAVQAEIDRYMNYYMAEEELIEAGTVADGDTIRIDYTGYLDGEAFDGGHAEGYDLTIGSGTFIPGFEESLIGATIGEMTTIDVTFPEEYGNADLAGKPTQFEVTIHAVVKKNIPELTEENVTELIDMLQVEATDVASFQEAIRKQLYETEEGYMKEELGLKVQEAVYANMVVNQTPEFLINRLYIRMNDNYNYYGQMYNMYYGFEDIYDGPTFLNAMNGIPVEEYSDYLKEEATEYANLFIGFKQIAMAEGIDVSDEDAMNEIESVYAEYGFESAEAFLETVTLDSYKDDLMFQTVLEYLVEKANVTYTAAE